jgi:hypothetical protein
MNQRGDDRAGYLDPADAAYIATVEDAEIRKTMLCAVTTFRRPDRLFVGDQAPDVAFLRLHDGARVRLEFPSNKPVVLFFGSYT